MAKRTTSMKKKRLMADIASYVTLAVLGILWVSPLFVLVINALRNERSSDRSYLWPKEGFSLHNFVDLFTETKPLNYPQWFMNTFIVAIFTCII